MSAIALNYPHSLPLRRSFSIRWILLLVAGLVLVASLVLVATSASVKADTASSVIAIPDPVAPAVDVEVMPAQTTTPAPSPVVIAVPVATPAFQ